MREQHLHNLFRSIDMKARVGPHTRAHPAQADQADQYLLKTGQTDSQLFWKDPD
jgi:hypothetical protein